MTLERLALLLEGLRGVRVGVVGDFCLDAYWQLDPGAPERSVETGKPTRAVRRHRYSLGGAGNVASNLTALGVRSVYGFSVINNDIFGREMLSRSYRAAEVDTGGMVIQREGWDTPVYAKPFREEEEQERVDFGRWNIMAADTEAKLSDALRTIVPNLDAVIVNQQLAGGVYSDAVVRSINAIATGHPSVLFLLDARTMSDRFTGMIVKLNASEAARVCAALADDGRPPQGDALRSFAASIGRRNGKPVYVTRSEEGILLFDGTAFEELPAVPVTGPTDPVGAGDTTVAAVTAALAAGATPREAGELGNLAAAVTVKKLRQTGTASPAEISRVASQTPR